MNIITNEKSFLFLYYISIAIDIFISVLIVILLFFGIFAWEISMMIKVVAEYWYVHENFYTILSPILYLFGLFFFVKISLKRKIRPLAFIWVIISFILLILIIMVCYQNSPNVYVNPFFISDKILTPSIWLFIWFVYYLSITDEIMHIKSFYDFNTKFSIKLFLIITAILSLYIFIIPLLILPLSVHKLRKKLK